MLKVWRGCFSPVCLRACVWGAPGRQEMSWTRGLRAGSRPAYFVHCICCAYGVGSQARNNSLLRQSRAVPTGSARGWLPFICPGGATVDRLLGSLQFRSPCGACVRDRGRVRGEKSYLDVRRGHSLADGTPAAAQSPGPS